MQWITICISDRTRAFEILYLCVLFAVLAEAAVVIALELFLYIPYTCISSQRRTSIIRAECASATERRNICIADRLVHGVQWCLHLHLCLPLPVYMCARISQAGKRLV